MAVGSKLPSEMPENYFKTAENHLLLTRTQKNSQNHAARQTKKLYIMKRYWNLVRKSGFEILPGLQYGEQVSKYFLGYSTEDRLPNVAPENVSEFDRRPLERPGCKWDNIKMDLQQTGWEGGGLYPCG
jgi:hypothetical protein